MGSGGHGVGYLIRLDDRLFQSPIAYYPMRRRFDLAPGFEQASLPDFNRPVTPECLHCHSGEPNVIGGGLNRYGDPPVKVEGISCVRCHGLSVEHEKRPTAGNVINPSKLAPDARDSICEQCHLSGESRVLNPGRGFGDFRPGSVMEHAFSVYVRSTPQSGDSLKVISHVEQLALSHCKRESGDALWCGTCHDPHPARPPDAEYYRRRCLDCHESGLSADHAAPKQDCIACHMVERAAVDGGHSAFTDHRIARRPVVSAAAAAERPLHDGELRAWREPDPKFRLRNLGLAYIESGAKTRSAFQIDEGFRILSDAYELWPGDPAVLSALGRVLLLKRANEPALSLLKKAAEMQPQDARALVELAQARRQTGSPDRALELLEHATSMDPYLESAYRLAIDICDEQGYGKRRNRILEAFLKKMPQNIDAQQAWRERPMDQ